LVPTRIAWRWWWEIRQCSRRPEPDGRRLAHW
jgi:hypothetical protein